MRVIVNRLEFLKKLRIVEKAISENKIKPILSCAYMETRDNQLFLCGTNMETTITTTLPCQLVELAGKVAFQYALIDEYIKELKEDEIQIRVENDLMIVEAGDAVSEFSIFQAEDYPRAFQALEESKTEEKISLLSTDLADIFDKLKFSAGLSDNAAIHCLRMEGREGKLHFVTTDTYRLTYLKKNYPITEDFQVSIPLEAIEACSKIFRGQEEEVGIVIEKRFVYFKMADIQIMTSLIELPFPKYQGILEQGRYDKTMRLGVGTLLSVLRRVMIFVRNNEESKHGATFHFEDRHFKIRGISDIAKINEDIEVNYEGSPLKVSLNTKYLFDFVQNLEKEKEISLEFYDSKSSVKVREEGQEDYLYILMPLALKD